MVPSRSRVDTAVAHDRHVVAQVEDFFHPVRDGYEERLPYRAVMKRATEKNGRHVPHRLAMMRTLASTQIAFNLMIC